MAIEEMLEEAELKSELTNGNKRHVRRGLAKVGTNQWQ